MFAAKKKKKEKEKVPFMNALSLTHINSANEAAAECPASLAAFTYSTNLSPPSLTTVL